MPDAPAPNMQPYWILSCKLHIRSIFAAPKSLFSMLIFQKTADLRRHLDAAEARGRHIGFAPTMGALHQGHLELVEMARQNGDMPVVSIFVNPTQFNDPKDLEKYPRTPERDVELLLGAGCEVLYMPPVEEVYPPGLDVQLDIDFGTLDQVMEGVFRPGHFNGMATVVNRLLDITRPRRLYMGQKDFQQLTIVRDMLRQTGRPTDLVMCPTVRESDGLAMSSRNTRLSPEMRAIAPVIHRSLLAAREALRSQAAADVQKTALHTLENAGLRPEYFDLVDGISLQPVQGWNDSPFIVACVAAFAGEVRLIDNEVMRQPL
jgi:pantoate--beta-alanine ligase